MINIRHRNSTLTKCKKLAVSRLMIAISVAMAETVWIIYMNSFGLSESAIGYLSAGIIVIATLLSILSTAVLEKYKENKILIISVLIAAISYLCLSINKSISVFIAISIVLAISELFRRNSFDIIFRDSSSKKELNKEEGFLYSLLNIGWLVGPLIGSLVLSKSGIPVVFSISAAFMIASLLFLVMSGIRATNKKRISIDLNPLRNIHDYIKQRSLRLSYLMAMGIGMWWSLVYIYMPLFMIAKGVDEYMVGIFFSCVVIPLIILEPKIGELSQKYGFKRFFMIGYLGLASSSLLLFFLEDIRLQLIIAAIASVFAAFIEPIRETYFFKHTKRNDEEKYYPLYSTSTQFGDIMAKILIASTLLVLPGKYAYITTFFTMTVFALITIGISSSDK